LGKIIKHSLQHILNKIKHFTTILEHSLKNATQPILKSKNFIENSEMFNASKIIKCMLKLVGKVSF